MSQLVDVAGRRLRKAAATQMKLFSAVFVLEECIKIRGIPSSAVPRSLYGERERQWFIGQFTEMEEKN